MDTSLQVPLRLTLAKHAVRAEDPPLRYDLPGTRNAEVNGRSTKVTQYRKEITIFHMINAVDVASLVE